MAEMKVNLSTQEQTTIAAALLRDIGYRENTIRMCRPDSPKYSWRVAEQQAEIERNIAILSKLPDQLAHTL